VPSRLVLNVSHPLRHPALDYPPFFAYFEKVLSIPASFIDPRIVDLNNLNYSPWSVIAYQRVTVILTELLLAAVLLKYCGPLCTVYHSPISSSDLFAQCQILIPNDWYLRRSSYILVS
jgi:alpha-1,3-glucosyltransferase